MESVIVGSEVGVNDGNSVSTFVGFSVGKELGIEDCGTKEGI